MLKRISIVILALLLLLAAAVAINTLRQGSHQLVVPPAPALALDDRAVADKLAGALRFQTISSLSDPEANAAEFHQLQDYLRQRFPRLHASLQRETVGGLSLLYTWKEQRSGREAGRVDGPPGCGAAGTRHREPVACQALCR